MSRILVAGYYGYGNLGDELILAAMIARLRGERPDLAITVATASPAETTARHGVDAVSWHDVRALIAAAEASDVLVLGGGGLFHDYWGCDPDALLQRHHAGLSQYLAPCLLASALGKPFMIYGVGVGPLLSDHGRQLTRAAFGAAAVATVRDESSRALLAEIGVDVTRVEVTADPAFDGNDSRAARDAAPVVAVALRSWDHGVLAEYWERQVAEGLDLFLDRRGGEAVFVSFQDAAPPFGDDPVAERVRAIMKPGRHRALDASQPPEARTAALRASSVVLGMRLHSLVVGAGAGCALVALAYDPKVTATMEMLGGADRSLDLGAITATSLAETLDAAWQQRAGVAARQSAAASELAVRARANATRLLKLLDEPFPPSGAEGASVALLKRTSLRLAIAADGVHRKTEEERRRLQARAESAEAAVQRWETSTAGALMRVWRRWRG